MLNDPLLGIADAHIKLHNETAVPLQTYYKDLSPRLLAACENKGEFAPSFEVIYRISRLFEHKADFGVRLKAAYDAGDKEALAKLVAECDVVIERIQELRRAHRKAWMTFNKPFGFEVHDNRYGAFASRFDTVKERVGAYLAGEIDTIEELDAPRRRLDGDTSTEAFSRAVNGIGFLTLSTAGVI